MNEILLAACQIAMKARRPYMYTRRRASQATALGPGVWRKNRNLAFVEFIPVMMLTSRRSARSRRLKSPETPQILHVSFQRRPLAAIRLSAARPKIHTHRRTGPPYQR